MLEQLRPSTRSQGRQLHHLSRQELGSNMTILYRANKLVVPTGSLFLCLVLSGAGQLARTPAGEVTVDRGSAGCPSPKEVAPRIEIAATAARVRAGARVALEKEEHWFLAEQGESCLLFQQLSSDLKGRQVVVH